LAMNCEFLQPSETSVDILVPSSESGGEEPTLLQKIKHEGSVLSLAISDEFIFAGTQRKNILVQRFTTPCLSIGLGYSYV
jgi:hypothetical protein